VLQHCEELVPTRVAIDRADDGEAEPAVEGWGLKIMGLQHDLPASTRYGTVNLMGPAEAS
jgi:hypothetical protein